MKISTKGRYAVRAMYEIATTKKPFVSIAEISQNQGISIKYLEQIISLLFKNNLVTSQKVAPPYQTQHAITSNNHFSQKIMPTIYPLTTKNSR